MVNRIEGTKMMLSRRRELFKPKWSPMLGRHGREEAAMTDLASLNSKIRCWLKRVPLPAMVVLLQAIHDELESRVVARSLPSRSREVVKRLRAVAARP